LGRKIGRKAWFSDYPLRNVEGRRGKEEQHIFFA
jgi:hypothetical protein